MEWKTRERRHKGWMGIGGYYTLDGGHVRQAVGTRFEDPWELYEGP